MIITRTPFRISFAGGGSDIDSFYKESYGAVISTSISKYMYVMIHPYFHNKIRIKYSKTEDVENIKQIQHPLARECIKLTRIGKGVEIASIADVPAGTGLGSSSSFTVGLLHALSLYKQKMRKKEWLAKTACEIEIEKVGEPIGKQDQYAASFGGLNYFRFNQDGTVNVEPVILKKEIRKKLEENLLLFYIGNERKAGNILCKQKALMTNGKKRKVVTKMVKLAEKMKDSLIRNDISDFGNLLHKGWVLKKDLSEGITNNKLETIYNKAIKVGAQGGKVLGAGGGGFFLFYCEKKYQDKLRKVLNLRELDFSFDNEGTKVVFYDG